MKARTATASTTTAPSFDYHEFVDPPEDISEEVTPNCGCEYIWCPLHRHAHQLLEVLTELLAASHTSCEDRRLIDAQKRAEQVIKEVTT